MEKRERKKTFLLESLMQTILILEQKRRMSHKCLFFGHNYFTALKLVDETTDHLYLQIK